MINSFPSSMLKTNQREVKDAATSEPVLVTDNDNRLFMFGGRATLTQVLGNLARRMAYEERIFMGYVRGEAEFARGEYFEGTADEAFVEMERRRMARA